MLHIDSRRQQIIQYIKENSSVTVNELLYRFDASASTIRSDLSFLEKNGIIRRTHGEAHFINARSLPPTDIRQTHFKNQKMKIAKLAAQYIRSNSTVAIDSGTTTYELTYLINEMELKNLTVITHSLDIASALSESSPSITIVMPGGIVSGQTNSLIGPDAEHFLSDITIDVSFISASGINRDGSLTCYLPFESSIKKCLISSANKKIAMIDSSKCGNSCVSKFGNLSQIDILLTDSDFMNSAVYPFVKKYTQIIMV